MVEEQVRPLAVTIDPNTDRKPTRTTRPRCYTRYIICPLGTLLFLFIITIIVLVLIVFKVKDPIMTLNKITFNLNTTTGTGSLLRPGSNISTTADVSIKNPNMATFRFSNTTSSIYYKGIMVGEAYGPSGKARARRTLRMNVTMEIITQRIIMAPNITNDIASGLFNMDSYTRVPGKVNFLRIIKKNVVVEMNCTVSYNITSQEIQDQSCKRHVDFK